MSDGGKNFKFPSDEDAVAKINKNNEINAVFNGTEPTPIEPDPNTVYWKSMQIRLKDKDLKKVLTSIRRIKKFISKMKTFVKSLKKIVELIRRLEELIKAPWERILEEIKKRLIRALREVGATGVYVLSTHEATSLGVTPIITTKEDVDITSDEIGDVAKKIFWTNTLSPLVTQKKDVETQVQKQEILNTTGDPNTVSSLFDLTNYTYSYTETVDGKPVKREINLGKHRALLYSEFIDIIAESFIDEMDLPDKSLINNVLIKKGDSKTSNPKKEISWDDFIERDPNVFLRPGRPYAEKGTLVQVMVIAFAVPNYSMFVANIVTMASFFGGVFEKAWESIRDPKFQDTMNTFLDKLKEFWEALKEDVPDESDDTNGDASATEAYVPYAKQLERAGSVVAAGEVPNFYGITLNSLFRPIFSKLEQVIFDLSGFQKKKQNQVKSALENKLSEIEKNLIKLERVLWLIEEIIKQIQALLALNLSVLKITSSEGNYDIYDKLINSKGFPSEEVQTPMFHFGLVFCSVLPTADSKGLLGVSPQAMKDYYKQTCKDFDEEIGEVVAESKDPLAAINQVLNMK